MTTLEVFTKANYVGVWLEDVLTDQIVNNIAAHSKAAKGKKVKVVLNNSGLRLRQTKWFQDKMTEFYPLANITTITKNTVFPCCVMFILADSKKKYRIVALRCASEGEAIQLVSMHSQIRCEGDSTNVEFRKRDNGNWTLSERSAHNANRQLAGIFNDKQKISDTTDFPAANGNVSNHVPILDKSKIQSTETSAKPHTSYIKRNGTNHRIITNSTNSHDYNNGNNNSGVVVHDGDDYVIETEVSSDLYSTGQIQTVYFPPPPNSKTPATNDEVNAFKGDLSNLTKEVRDIKDLLEVMNVKDYPGAMPTTALPSKPVVHRSMPAQYASTGTVTTPSVEPGVYRAFPRTYEAQPVTPMPRVTNYDPWSPYRRPSGNIVLPVKMGRQPNGMESGRSSLRVKFDTESVRSGGSTWGRSKKNKRKSVYSLPTTVQRSIEETYARQPSVSRRNSAHITGRSRPASFHAVGNNEPKVVYPYNRYMDVVL